MTASRHLLLLGLGLCLVISHSLSEDVKVYGGDSKNPYEDVTWQLEKQRKDKLSLETLLEKTTDAKSRSRIEKDIDKITTTIAKMETKFRVVYKDHIEAIKDKTQNIENEKAKMKKELEAAEERHAKAVTDMQEAKKKDLKQIGAYQAKLEESTNQMEKLERDYATIKELRTQQLEKEKEEKENLIKVREELTKELQLAQYLHAKAIEAMSVSITQENVKRSSLPYEHKIMELKNKAAALRYTKDTWNRRRGFDALQKELKHLYELLLKKANLPNNVSLQELEKMLNVIKVNAKNVRIEQTSHRAALVDQLQKKELRDYTDEEIEALQTVNKQVATTDIVLKEVAQRKMFLKAMKEVALLMKESLVAAN